ncbi:MAG: hypothetical protein ABSF76_14325 [Opitutaceae bacterium]|jgi:hypothetical protein
MTPPKISRGIPPLFFLATLAFAGARVAAQSETSTDPFAAFVDSWTATVQAAQASQPSWITPLATTTPRLEQEFRYDQDFETLIKGKGRIDVYGGGKGLEVIPTERTEVILTMPPYQVRTGTEPSSGLNDWPGILVKYRILSADAKSGDYIVTVFAQYGLPTGALVLTNHNDVFTPTLAAGKGFGDFDVQATIGEGIPIHDHSNSGRSIQTNITAQYHLTKLLWPEIEMNRTDWIGGARGERTQTYLTPGLIVGRMVLSKRSKLIVGLGYQTAVSRVYGPGPITPTFNHNWVLTARVTF